jgi:hypothetical protein
MQQKHQFDQEKYSIEQYRHEVTTAADGGKALFTKELKEVYLDAYELLYKAQEKANDEAKSLSIIVGEEHGSKSSYTMQFVIAYAALSLGIDNIAIERDKKQLAQIKKENDSGKYSIAKSVEYFLTKENLFTVIPADSVSKEHIKILYTHSNNLQPISDQCEKVEQINNAREEFMAETLKNSGNHVAIFGSLHTCKVAQKIQETSKNTSILLIGRKDDKKTFLEMAKRENARGDHYAGDRYELLAAPSMQSVDLSIGGRLMCEHFKVGKLASMVEAIGREVQQEKIDEKLSPKSFTQKVKKYRESSSGINKG